MAPLHHEQRHTAQEIKEGGGLSSLRRRIEKAGGTVTVHSLPVFVLEVTLPDKESIYDTRYDR